MYIKSETYSRSILYLMLVIWESLNLPLLPLLLDTMRSIRLCWEEQGHPIHGGNRGVTSDGTWGGHLIIFQSKEWKWEFRGGIWQVVNVWYNNVWEQRLVSNFRC